MLLKSLHAVCVEWPTPLLCACHGSPDGVQVAVIPLFLNRLLRAYRAFGLRPARRPTWEECRPAATLACCAWAYISLVCSFLPSPTCNLNFVRKSFRDLLRFCLVELHAFAISPKLWNRHSSGCIQYSSIATLAPAIVKVSGLAHQFRITEIAASASP